MSTILRSVRYLRRLNVGCSGRRLGSSLHRVADELPSRTNSLIRCVSSFPSDRNYVTAVAAEKTSKRSEPNYKRSLDVDSLLNDIDQKIKIYGYINKDTVDEVMNAILRKGTATSVQALLLIRCCGNFLNVETLNSRQNLVKNAWQLINDLGIQLDVSHYNSLLLVNLENETNFSPVDVLVEMKEKNIEPNRVTFQRLISKYCNDGDIAGATKILEHMQEKEIPINDVIFNSLIKGHSINGNMDKAIETLDIMKQSGVEPSSQTYSEILCGHARTGDIEAIRQVLGECKKKDIPFSDKEILEIIYIAAISEQHDLIDEIMTAMPKGYAYNRELIFYIPKLIEKDQVEVAYKLFKSMRKVSKSLDDDYKYSGFSRFFIKKLITSDAPAETIVKYCKLIKEEKINENIFEYAILNSYLNNMHHLALPMLSSYKEIGGDVREHFFYPIFVAFGKANNLQGIINTIKTMTFELEISPSVFALKEFVFPYMVGEDLNSIVSNVSTLVNNNVMYTVSSVGMISYLLEEKKLNLVSEFLHTLRKNFNSNIVKIPLVKALLNTNDKKSFVQIVHWQYTKLSDANLMDDPVPLEDESTEKDQLRRPKEWSSALVQSLLARKIHKEDLTDILERFLQKGVGIDAETVEKVISYLGPENVKPETIKILNDLSSDQLVPEPIININNKRYENVNRTVFARTVGSDRGELTPDLKMALTVQHMRNSNYEMVEKLLKEMEEENTTYTLGFCSSLVDYYSKQDKVEEAENWLKRKAEIEPDSKMDRSKILNYALALARINRIDDALKALDFPVLDEESDRSIQSRILLKTISKNFPEKTQEFFYALKNKGFVKEVTSAFLNPIVKCYLDANEIEKAIEKCEWACENFNIFPCKILIMMKLIETEDAKNLQRVTDLCTKIRSEMNALFDLATAFFECDRIKQARKILETPGFRILRGRVVSGAETYKNRGQIERLENWIELFNGIMVDMDQLYQILLDAYEQTGDYKKCLSLWVQLQELNVQPSKQFMQNLERILINNNQEVPFARTINIDETMAIDEKKTQKNRETMHKAEFNKALLNQNYVEAERLLTLLPLYERNVCLVQLAEFYVHENKLDQALNKLKSVDNKLPKMRYFDDSVRNIVSKLTEYNDFSNVSKIFNIIAQVSRRRIGTLSRILNTKYDEAGKYSDFISYMENILEKPEADDEADIDSIFHIGTAACVAYNNPEIAEKLEKFALKANDVGITSPINALWICKFLQNSPQGEEIYNKYLANSSKIKTLYALSVIRDLKLFEKTPELIEIVMKNDKIIYNDKRKTLSSVIEDLLESDNPKKYELAYECIRLSIKTIPLDRLKVTTISEIEQNLTDGKTFDVFREESKREKEQVST